MHVRTRLLAHTHKHILNIYVGKRVCDVAWTAGTVGRGIHVEFYFTIHQILLTLVLHIVRLDMV